MSARRCRISGSLVQLNPLPRTTENIHRTSGGNKPVLPEREAEQLTRYCSKEISDAFQNGSYAISFFKIITLGADYIILHCI